MPPKLAAAPRVQPERALSDTPTSPEPSTAPTPSQAALREAHQAKSDAVRALSEHDSHAAGRRAERQRLEEQIGARQQRIADLEADRRAWAQAPSGPMPELPPEARAEIDERRAEVACLQSAIETIDRELSELEERRSYAVRRVDAATEGVRQAALSLLAERLYSAADYTEAAIIEFERRLIHTSAIKAVLDAESWDRVRNGNVAEAGFRAYAVANRVTSLRSRLQRPTASEVLEVAKEEVEALLAALINQEKSE